MKKLISTMVMLLILMFALSTTVQAYSMSFTGKTEVESGETFDVTISVDEPTTLANGYLYYDSSLFTFVGATQTNMAAQAYPTDGKVQWMYTELVQEPVGVSAFTFTFKAAEVEETKKGTFTLNDFIVTTKEEAEYDQSANTISGKNSVEVTINKKEVKPAEPTWTLKPSTDFELEVGDIKTIETDGDVTWKSSDPKVATVDKNGKVTAVKEGTVTITATDKDGNTKSVKVTVVAKDELTLSPSGNIKLEIGETQKIETNKEVTWTTSNSKVATVDKNGNIKAVGAGTATITATDEDGNTKTIKVTVVKKEATGGNKDNTTTPDKKLPQTGEDFTRFACLGIAAVILAAGLVFKKKAKNLGKLFVILPLVAIMSISGAVNAIKIVDDETMKAGVFAKGELLEDEDVVAVSPCKNFTTEDTLSVETLESLLNSDTQHLVAIEDSEGNEIDLEATKVPTGAVAWVSPIAGEDEVTTQVSEDYTVLLYGDANGDGKICNCLDVNVIRQDYVFNNKAEGVYKLAADLYADDVLNVRDVQRMVKKYLGTLDGSVVTPFPGEKEIVLDTDDNITLKIGEQITITPEDPNVTWSWDTDNKSAYVSTTVDGVATITGANCGTIELTVTDENGNEKTISVTVIGGTIVLNTCTSTTIETEVSLDIEGKEIASIEHFYAFQAGYVQGTNEPRSAGTTTENIFTYTNEILALNNPYTFYAEITTTDGEVYRTNSVSWFFGTEYPKPSEVKATMTIKDYTQGSITVEAAIEGKEIASVKHYYREQPGFTSDPYNEWDEVKDAETAEYIYTTKELTDGWPYQFMAEITTTDGKVFETDIASWQMGNIGPNPAITVTATTNEDTATITTEVTNDVIVNQYSYTLQKKNDDGTYSTVGETVRTENPEYTFEGLEDGDYQVVAVASTEKGAYTTKFVNFEISTLLPGETLDESEAVAKLLPDNRLFKTVQDAANAIDESGTVQLLKDVEESVIVPETATGAVLDLNGHILTAVNPEYAITNNGNLTIMNSNTSAIGQVTTPLVSGFKNENLHTIITKGNLTITTNDEGTSITQINLHPKADVDSTATIKNIGTNNTIKLTGGANLGGSANPTRYLNAAILDENTGSTIIVEKANIGAYIGIKKTGSGTINIGTNEQELWGNATGPTDPLKIDVQATYAALLVDENVKVNFYNGYLGSARDQVSKNLNGTTHKFDEHRTGYGSTVSIAGGEDMTYAYYKIFDAENNETVDEQEAVVRITTAPGGRYKSVTDAINAVIDSGYRGATMELLQSTTESVVFPENMNINFDLNGYSITGANKDSSAKEGATLKVNGNVEILNSSETKGSINPGTVIESGKNNIYVTGEGNLTLKENVVIEQTVYGNNIFKDGTGDIIIDGAEFTSTTGAKGIYDIGTSGNIYVYSGKILGYMGAIIKTGSGNIYIGKDSTFAEGIDGIQEDILTHKTTPRLWVTGATNAIKATEDVNVYWYNGELQSTYSDSVKYNPICADYDTGEAKEYAATRTGAVITDGDAGNHSFIFVEASTATVDAGADALEAALEAAQ